MIAIHHQREPETGDGGRKLGNEHYRVGPLSSLKIQPLTVVYPLKMCCMEAIWALKSGLWPG
jgi:hypothetical protein